MTTLKMIMFSLLFTLNTSFIFSQETTYSEIIDQVKKKYPEIRTENKLLFVNVFLSGDNNSRESNIQLEKVSSMYEFAKLKGGREGLIGVIVSINEDNKLAEVSITKDKLIKTLLIDKNGLSEITFNNIVYDCTGKEVFRNLSNEEFQKSVGQLITR